MSRYPEQLQFRAAPGTTSAIHALAEAEGKRPGEVIREAVESRLANSKATPASAPQVAA